MMTRMNTYDESREKVIKRSREIQKAAKQAIFALHRDDHKKADKLMGECEKVAGELSETIENEKSLRYVASYRAVRTPRRGHQLLK